MRFVTNAYLIGFLLSAILSVLAESVPGLAMLWWPRVLVGGLVGLA